MAEQYSPEELKLLAQLSPSVAAAIAALQATREAAVRDHNDTMEPGNVRASAIRAYGESEVRILEGYKIKQEMPHDLMLRRGPVGQWYLADRPDHPAMKLAADRITGHTVHALAKMRVRALLDEAKKTAMPTPSPYRLCQSRRAVVPQPEVPTTPTTAFPIEVIYRAAMQRSEDEDRFVMEADDSIPFDFMECITHTLEPHEHHVLFAER